MQEDSPEPLATQEKCQQSRPREYNPIELCAKLDRVPKPEAVPVDHLESVLER